MSDLLVILNPRAIPSVIEALEALDIDRLWLRRMTESQIADAWTEVIATAERYDNLILFSDDAIVRPHALAAVRELLADHPVVTGYSNLSIRDMRVNLSRSPLAALPAEDAYDLYTLGECLEWPTPTIPTYVAGMCLTGMSVELWAEHRFQVWGAPPGCCSDFMLSKSLERAGVPIVAAREGFVWHLKERWNEGDRDHSRRLLVGVEPAQILLDERVAA